MLTRTRQPNQWSAGYSPVVYEFESSFDSLYTTLSRQVTLYEDSNGFVKWTFSGAHGFVVGQPIILVNPPDSVGGVQVVISVPNAFSVVTDKGYDDSGIVLPASFAFGYADQYRMVVQVRAIIDSVDTLIGTITVPYTLDGVTPVFQVDVSGALKQYITQNLHTFTEGLELNEDSFLKFYIKYAEGYLQGSGGLTVYTVGDFETDINSAYAINYRWIVNGCMQYGTTDINDFVVNGSQEARWLTDKPGCKGVLNVDRSAFAYFISETFETSQDWVFKQWTVDVNGNIIDSKFENDHSARTDGSYSWLVNFDNLTYTGAKYIKAQMYLEETLEVESEDVVSLSNSGGFCRWVINGAFDNIYVGKKIYPDAQGGGGTDSWVGVQYITQVISATEFITDRVYDDSLSGDAVIYEYQQEALTEEICWLIDTECHRYETELHWLNTPGGYDSFSFTGKRDKSRRVERLGEIKYQLFPDNFIPPNRQHAFIKHNSRDKITARHTELDQETYEWLCSMIESQDIFIRENGQNYPVNIDLDSVVMWSDGAKVNTIEFDFIRSYDRVVQTR